MIRNIRPYQIFQHLEDNRAELIIPTVRGTESLTIMAVETLLLIAVARIVKAETILELGTGMGYTAMHLAMNTKATIITVDKDRKPTMFDGTKREIFQVISDFANYPPNPRDMVFCDCDINLELCRHISWLAFECNPKVVVWHDYGKGTDQTKHLDNLERSLDLYRVEDTSLCLWFADGREL